MGQIVGESDGVDNDPGDKIVYAKRLNRNVFTPFNKTKKPVPCSVVSVSFARQADGSYLLMSAWIGNFEAPAFLGDINETADSKAY